MNHPADDERHIHTALTRLRDATRLPLAFGGPVNARRQVQLTQFAGANKGALRGVALDFGLGLGGKVVARRQPLVVNDYVASEGISHHYDHVITAEGLRAMVAVPVVVRQAVRGVLYCTTRSTFPLGDRVVQTAMETARELEQTLAVRDEIGRRLDQLTRHEPPPRPGPRPPGSTERELMREAYTELRILANDLRDPALRERVDAVCRKLSGATATGAGPTLSGRELDVLACVALGWTNAQTADDLGITLETVKSYLRTATRKLQARSRLEAVVTARRLGLLP
ncbi:LuxR C-terminal-related transcriptional regulator [Nonomuraea sp. CA-141351]|uniref:helix-turn-helix transcriptional regulator n=1 Tax=Nonomuraea sp. CA-141351 TaxID=3239996 RepID=UPI003D902E89